MGKLRIAALALAACAFCCAHAVELRYAHVGNEGDIQTIYVERADEAVRKATDGRVGFRIFPASQLGGVQEMVDGVKMGSIHIGHHDFASLATLVPDVAVFNAPFVYRDGEHALKATDPKTSEALQLINEQLIESGGMRIIGRIYRGTRNISSNFPIYKPSDMTGKPFRAVPLPLWVSMVKGFTAIPTPVEVSELPTALMTGLVVGQENPLTMINANKIYEVQSHISMTGHMHSVLAVFVNEEYWQAMRPEDRDAVEKVLDEMAWESLKWANDTDQELIDELTAKKITFIFPENGLDIPAFEESVLKQINQDFPSFAPLIESMKAIK